MCGSVARGFANRAIAVSRSRPSVIARAQWLRHLIENVVSLLAFTHINQESHAIGRGDRAMPVVERETFIP
jgi:hypothetical protein